MIKKINIQNNLIAGIILLSFILRIVFVFFVRDSAIENEWGILLNNLIEHKSYSFYTFDSQLLPSAYMPPMYAFFLYIIKIISNFEQNHFIYLIIFIQILISTFSVYIFFQINRNFFSKKLSIINSIIYSIVPLNIYACGQISSVNLQIFLSLLFLKFLFLILKNQNTKNIIYFSIISGLLMLTRGEFILIFSIIFLFIFLNKKIKIGILARIIVIVILVISPYLIRNYIQFNEVFIVKTLGYNLWKGNNKLSSVEGYENYNEVIKVKIDNLKKNNFYEINKDNIFLEEAINNIKKDSLAYTNLFFKKIISYYFVNSDSNYPNYYNFFHIFPLLLISILSLPGFFIFCIKGKFENKCLFLYLVLNLIIFSIFFILPRYKLVILPVQIIFATYAIEYVLNKIKINILNK